MRIVGGRFKGRTLLAPTSRSVRPTSDRLREALFNVLQHAYDDACTGARVIDLFAGTGALGLEALSREAAYALFVDEGSEARACLRGNVEALGVAGITRVFRRDATRLGRSPGPPFDVAFLDPPYGRGLVEPTLAGLAEGGWLAPQALCIVEEASTVALDLPTLGFRMLERREQGETQLVICRFQGAV